MKFALLLAAVCFISSIIAIRAEEKGKQHELVMSLDKVVTAEMAAEVSGFPEESGTKAYTPSPKYPQTDVLTYSWDNGRKRMAGAIEVPAMDTVKIGWLRKSFKEALQAKTFDPNFKDFMEKVADLGELSLWNSRDQQLIVFQKGTEFSVWVNVSADVEVNKTKAIQLAEKILSGALK